MAEKDLVLKCTNLTVGHGKKALISRWDAELVAGEVAFLMGPNGAGKSSLLKTLAGVVNPMGGQISFVKDSAAAYLPAHPHVFDGLKLADLLDFFHVHNSQWKDQSEKAWEIQDFIQTPLSELSSGERQRCFLHCVICSPNKLVLLDEPINYLEWKHSYRLWSFIKEQVKSGRSFIIAIHDFHWVREFGPSLGWFVNQGEPPQILKLPDQMNTIFAKMGLKTLS